MAQCMKTLADNRRCDKEADNSSNYCEAHLKEAQQQMQTQQQQQQQQQQLARRQLETE